MKTNIFIIPLFIFFFLAIIGCNHYSSSVPITNNKKSYIDTALLGVWEYYENDTLVCLVKIIPMNKKELLVDVIMFNETKNIDFWQSYIIHNSKIGPYNYFNFKILELENEDENEYCFFTHTFKKDTLVSKVLLNENFKKEFKSSKKFYRYVNKNNKEFYGLFEEYLKFTRKKD